STKRGLLSSPALFGYVSRYPSLPDGNLTPMPPAMLPDLKRFVGSSQYRPLSEMSPKPLPFSIARGPGVGCVFGLGMPHAAFTYGMPTFIDKRSLNWCVIVRSTRSCVLTTYVLSV